MPVAPFRITKTKLLLGEGRDEVRFFTALLGHLGITAVQVLEYGGKQQLASFLRALILSPDFVHLASLGITRDADGDAAAAFQSVSAALGTAGLSVPAAHARTAGTTPQVQVWIMPDGARPGMLEDLCLESVRTDLAFPCLDDYFACALRTSNRQPNNMAKARVHAWLAAEVEPDKRLGEAAEAGYWPWNHPAFQPLIAFPRVL